MPYVPVDPLSGAGYVTEVPRHPSAAGELPYTYFDAAQEMVAQRRTITKQSIVRRAIHSVMGVPQLTDRPDAAQRVQQKGPEEL